MMNTKNQSKTRKFVRDGVFYAELNEFLTRMLGEDGYAGLFYCLLECLLFGCVQLLYRQATANLNFN